MPAHNPPAPLDLLPQEDSRFSGMFQVEQGMQCIDRSCCWAEGPVYLARLQSLVWSDIPQNRMLRWHLPSQTTSVFRSPSNFANGNTLDAAGRLLTCEHGTRRLVRQVMGQALEVLASSWNGRRLNSPNDVVVARDGGIWFTDPSYGIDSDYEGYRADSEIGACHVYRIDPHTGRCDAMITDVVRPNGIALNPAQTMLYVSDTGGTHVQGGPRHIRVFALEGGAKLSGGRVFAECAHGYFDGFRVDAKGRVWTSAGDGVHCYSPQGVCLGKIRIPQTVANLEFGGVGRNDLFVCATHAVYRVRMAQGWQA